MCNEQKYIFGDFDEILLNKNAENRTIQSTKLKELAMTITNLENKEIA